MKWMEFADSHKMEETPSEPHSASPASSTNLSDPRQTSGSPDMEAERASSESPLIGFADDGAAPDHHCPYCHKPFRQPRLLHCLHALCEDCIIALLEGNTTVVPGSGSQDRSASGSGSVSASCTPSALSGLLEEELEPAAAPKAKPPPGVIRCPVCQQDSQIGNDARFAHMLLMDHVRISLMEASALRNSDMACESCKTKDKAVARCEDCSNFLCGNCVQAHQFMRCFDGHNVQGLEELRQSDGPVPHRPIGCIVHSGRPLQCYCSSCDAPVCQECLVSDHAGPGHAVQRVDAPAATVLRDQLTELVAAGTGKADYCNKLSGQLEQSIATLRDNVDAAREHLDEEFAKYQALLDEKKAAMAAQLEKLADGHEDHIRDISRGFSSTAERLQDVCDFTERLLQYGSAMEVLVTRKAVLRQLQTLVHAAPSPSAPTNLHFLSDPTVFSQALDAYAGVFKSDLIQPGFSGAAAAAGEPWKADINTLLRKLARPALPNQPVNSSAIPAPNYVDPGAFPYPASNPPPLPAQTPPFGAPGPAQTPTGSDQPNMEALAKAIAMMNNQPNGAASTAPSPPWGGPSDYRQTPAPVGPPDPTHPTSAFAAPAPVRPAPAPITSPLHPPEGFTPFGDSAPFGTLAGLQSTLGTPAASATESALPKPAVPGKTQPMQVRNKFGSLGQAQSQFNSPHGFCLGPDEEIVVADTNNHRIQVFLKDGTFKFQFGVPGKEEGQCWYPRKVGVMRQPEARFVVCDRGAERSRMQIFNKNGQFLRRINIKFVDIVAGMAMDQNRQQIVVVDSVSPTVFRIGENGELIKWFSVAQYMKEPSDIAVSNNELYICDFKGHSVCVFTEEGQFSRRIGSEKMTSFPNGIDISNQGDVLIGDSHGNRFHVSVFRKNGEFESEFDCPYVKVSRCCGLRITEEGFLVTLAKNNHHVLVLNTLYLP